MVMSFLVIFDVLQTMFVYAIRVTAMTENSHICAASGIWGYGRGAADVSNNPCAPIFRVNIPR
jgi:hypothetical protein